MGWRHRSLRAFALGTGIAAISVLAVLPSAAAKSAAPDRGAAQAADLSTVPAIKKYLRSVGVDTRGLVVQRGPRNYAGPNCPGPAWNCTQSTKVVQVSALRADDDDDDDGENRFVCRRARGSGTQTASAPCVITQGASSTNSATCDISTTSSGAAISQTCLITQGGNSNTATAKLSALLRGNAPAQEVNQRIEILQTGGSAGNNLTATQNARIRVGSGGDDDDDDDDVRRSGSASAADVSRTQDFHQVVCTNQQATGGGANSARVTQDGRATATFRNVGDVLIQQNTDEVASACSGAGCAVRGHHGVGPQRHSLCPIESDDSGTAKANANTCARVQQVSGTGKNSIVQRQSSRLDADVDRAARSRSRRARCWAESTPLRIRSRAASRPTTTGRTRIRTRRSSAPTASTWIRSRIRAAAPAATSSETAETRGRSSRTSRSGPASTDSSSIPRRCRGRLRRAARSELRQLHDVGNVHRPADAEQQRGDGVELVYRLELRRVHRLHGPGRRRGRRYRLLRDRGRRRDLEHGERVLGDSRPESSRTTPPPRARSSSGAGRRAAALSAWRRRRSRRRRTPATSPTRSRRRRVRHGASIEEAGESATGDCGRGLRHDARWASRRRGLRTRSSPPGTRSSPTTRTAPTTAGATSVEGPVAAIPTATSRFCRSTSRCRRAGIA